MSEHALTISETGWVAYCSCGWEVGTHYPERMHAEHVQQEADWNAIDKALDLAEDQGGGRFTPIGYTLAIDAGQEALARLRGKT